MKVIVSVINDLSTDQRVHKTCTSLNRMGFDVHLVGRRQRKSLPLSGRNYSTTRMFLLFESGVLFYCAFQWRLFWFLMFRKTDLLVSNDLDTLLPNYLISRLKNIPLVYDTHELFCEVPELQRAPLKRKIWKGLERFIFPRLKSVFTVNDSIARIYSEEYGVPVHVLRNLPFRMFPAKQLKSRSELGLPEHLKIILLQGAGINMDRGGEEAVLAMQSVTNAILLIIGSGDVLEELKRMADQPGIKGKVIFIPRLPFEELWQYTCQADIGLTLDKDTNRNYRFSLPNKIFDYIHAGVPVLSSDLVEPRKIIEAYHVGCVISDMHPEALARLLNAKLGDTNQLKIWKENTKIAARELCWEQEEERMKQVYKCYLEENPK